MGISFPGLSAIQFGFFLGRLSDRRHIQVAQLEAEGQALREQLSNSKTVVKALERKVNNYEAEVLELHSKVFC